MSGPGQVVLRWESKKGGRISRPSTSSGEHGRRIFTWTESLDAILDYAHDRANMSRRPDPDGNGVSWVHKTGLDSRVQNALKNRAFIV